MLLVRSGTHPIDGERANKRVTIITGGFLGALAVILLMLLAVVGTAIFIKKGIQNYISIVEMCIRLILIPA